MIVKHLHLIISIVIVLAVSLVYGFQPNLLFEVTINSTDEHNIFKAIMGLYLGFSVLWIVGLFLDRLWKTATVSNIVFMLGLAFGRIISMLLDGFPTTVFVVGTIGELVLGLFAYYQLKRQPNFN